jgi:hypothetical protein
MAATSCELKLEKNGANTMGTIQPVGEDLRKAVKWLSAEHTYNPDKKYSELIEEACLKFNLSPKEAAYLAKFVDSEK